MFLAVDPFTYVDGQYIAVQDGLQGLALWSNLLPGGDRVLMDGHSYFAFGGDNPAPMDIVGEEGQPGGIWPSQACEAWGGMYNERHVVNAQPRETSLY